VKLFTGLAAACVALTSIVPSYAQTAPSGSWLSGPDGQGPSTIVGRIETPSRTQNVASGANVLVSGWAVDTSASGWTGIDGVEVWNGAKDKGGTKLASGQIGNNRTDISDALGAYYARAGFSAVIPAASLSSVKPGAVPLYVYLHTPGKGTWYRTAGFNLTAPTALTFANDPIVGITKPQDGTAITQLQRNSKFTFTGFALDRNPITNPNTQTTGPGCSGCTLFANAARGAGIANIIVNIDTPVAARGDNSVFGVMGAPCTSCLYGTPLVSNLGFLNVPGRQQGSIITRNYGDQFDYSGWSASINPQLLSPGWHTLYATATSSITGKQNTASATFQILDMSHKKIQP
jgi:hypothetical protein